MKFKKARDIQARVKKILKYIEMSYINAGQLACIRSHGSKARARARIWAFPSIWQEALGLKPHYVIEVISEKFDHLSFEEQTKILIHELLHIPKTFSGALRPHRMRYFHLHAEVEKFYRSYRLQGTKNK